MKPAKVRLNKIEDNWEEITETIFKATKLLKEFGYTNQLSSAYILSAVAYYIFKKKTIYGDTQDLWLNKTLVNLRNQGESAYLLGHIFPTAGESTEIYNQWLLYYLHEYSDVIKGSYFGHSHNDEFRLLTLSNKTSPILVSPSLMADKRDPCFRIYHYHIITNLLTDYHQYCVDLTKTNKLDTLQVYLDYRFSSEYGLLNITGTSYNHLLDTLRSQDQVAIKYCQNFIGRPSGEKKCTLNLARQLVEQLVIN